MNQPHDRVVVGQSSSGSVLGRAQSAPSRSGSVGYGGNTNQNRGDARNNGMMNIPPPPVVNNSVISREASREAGRIRQNYDGYRSGYYHYDRGWRDSYFWYPHYAFHYGPACYPSPFYYYPHLPGYISTVRVNLGFVTISWSQGRAYEWRYQRSNNWGWSDSRNYQYNRALDQTVDDIYDAFRRQDSRFLDNVIPYRGWVNVEVDNHVQYRLGSEDFYDMMRDLVEGTFTTNYRIRNVRSWNGGAMIEADHEYRSPWGRNERTRHYYGLRETGRGYELTHFRILN